MIQHLKLYQHGKTNLQAIMYEDSLYTRVSHYSYEFINNKLRLYPAPRGSDNFAGYLDRIWFKFRINQVFLKKKVIRYWY
jgi:hypothetical protein